MIKEVVKVKLPDDLKNKAVNLIDETINKVMDTHGESISNKELSKIRNLTLDQINVNVTSRASLKSLWVLNIEQSIPVIVEKEIGMPELNELPSKDENKGLYKMKPNLTWTFNKDNLEDDGVSRRIFENTIIEMLFEDIETAAFYGALSCVGDINDY